MKSGAAIYGRPAVINVGVFTSGQKQFLDFHRETVLLQSNRG
jgi:hypothetical protein